MSVITTTDELAALCNSLAKEEFVTIDTEFIREKTYYPQLCLVQLAGPDKAAAIDPLAKGISLDPLLKLLANKNVLKVFHASRQDIEIFYQLMRAIPSPVFDTQIAAMVCGYGESVGYEPLVSKLLGQQVDKSSRFTDWARRPLTEKQLAYALSDVTHLRDVYTKLKEQIDREDRRSWIEEEMTGLSDPKRYEADPAEVWRRLKTRTRSGRFLAMLREVARWRELEAQKDDVPRGRIMKDETLVEVAATAPRTQEELHGIRGFGGHLAAKKIKSLLEVIEKGRSIPASEYPQGDDFRKTMPEGSEGMVELLRVLLKIRCDEQGVAHRLVAAKEDIEDFVLGKPDIPFLQGWRREIFGKFAEALVKGELAITYDRASKRVVLLEPGKA